MSNVDIAAQLFSGAASLAGMVLVFLGFVVAHYESFDKLGKAVVKGKYKSRAILAFWGFISALIAATLGLFSNWLISPVILYIGMAVLGFSILSVVMLAIITVRSIK